jgi:mannose-1-phosphate guanylyltransferase/phosphomannomutase
VVRSGAALGVLVDSAGERLLVVDETGRPVPEESVSLIMNLLTMKSGAAVVAPVTAPGSVEKMAERLGAQVVRTKSSPRAQMEAERLLSEGGTPYFHAVSDALLTLARLLEAMARDGVPLSRLVAEIPPYHTARDRVPCDWDAKGRVMRSLLEEYASDERVDLTDGVKVYPEAGKDVWALVLPDADAPYFHIISEGRSPAEAAEILSSFRERLLTLEGNGSPM